MKTCRTTNNLVYNPGIYFNTKDCEALREGSVRRKTFRKRMVRKLQGKHHIVDKIKIAFSLYVIVYVMCKLFIG